MPDDLRTRYKQVADSDVFMCRDCRVGSRHLLIHQTEAHDRWHDRNPDG